MLKVAARLLVALTSVFLLVLSTNSGVTAIEKSGSDPTRPSESIEAEEPDSIQDEEIGGNQSNRTNTPSGGKPDIETNEQDLSYNKIKVKFDELVVYRNWESNSDCKDANDYCTDATIDHAEWNLVAYVQGKKIDLFTPDDPVHTRAGGFHHGIFGKEITVNIQKPMPLSIIIVGYEEDGCRHYEYPEQIEQSINDALSHPTAFTDFSSASLLGKYPKLKTIEFSLNKDVNAICIQDQDHHEVFWVIDKVYEPLSKDTQSQTIIYGEGSHIETNYWKSPQYPQYQPLKIYDLEYTISVPQIGIEVDQIQK